MTITYDLIIIGAGPAGYIAAERAGGLGKKVLIVEQEHLGGVCLNWGCIPTKTLLACAKVYHHAAHGEDYGVTAKEVLFDLVKAMERKRGVVETLRKGVGGLMKKFKVEVVTGTAVVKDAPTITVDGTDYVGTNLLLCPGSKPILPPIPGADQTHVIDSTGMLGITALPKSLCVIGGGVIGVEFACFQALLGVPVTVIEMMPEIVPGVDEDIARILRGELEKKGIVFHLGAKVTAIGKDTVTFTDAKGAECTADATSVLMSVGRMPNTAGLGLEALGLAMDRAAIKTDERQATNLPGVWAAGDVTGKSMLAHAASRMAEVAVTNMFGGNDRMRYEAIPGVIYTSPEVAVVGRTEAGCKAVGIPVKALKVPMSVNGRYLAEFEGRGMAKVIVHAQTGAVLGVHLVGGAASEMIHSACMAIELELTAAMLKEIVFPHPTVSEVMRDVLFHL